MSKITYEQRCRVYGMALSAYGKVTQMTVAIEELSEAQKELCKLLRCEGDLGRLADEVADATIMLEQICEIFSINQLVNERMDFKIKRLERRIKEGHYNAD